MRVPKSSNVTEQWLHPTENEGTLNGPKESAPEELTLIQQVQCMCFAGRWEASRGFVHAKHKLNY
jgi:hypothetical protein